jgi:hypothetical protein
VYVDVDAAIKVFDEAISAGAGAQALLHAGRAASNHLLVLKSEQWLGHGRMRLQSACDLKRDRAYPRYLLSILERLSGAYYRDVGRLDESRRAMEESLRLALEAQRVEPDDPRGYIAEAEYYEEVEDWEHSLAARGAMDSCGEEKKGNVSGYPEERWKYAMRIHFWRGEYREAQLASRAMAGDPESGAGSDAAVYAAIFARSDGDEATARRLLTGAVARVGRDAEERLKLHAAFLMLGFDAPPDLLAEPLNYDNPRTPRWTAGWLRDVVEFQRDDLPFDDLMNRLTIQYPEHEGDRRRAMSGAEFYRGVKALCTGNRRIAIDALTNAYKQHDMENYCFRAKLLRYKLKLDNQWPAWLPDARSSLSPKP